jgi:hypothetical protein
MQGILVKPVGYEAGKKYPMVTWVHGGPTSASTFRYPSDGYVQLLAARGIVVFLPNYRGSVGWGVRFAESNLGDLGGKDFEDIMAGIDAARRVSPTRVWGLVAGVMEVSELGDIPDPSLQSRSDGRGDFQLAQFSRQ